MLIEEAEKEYELAEELCYKQDLESAMEHVRNVEGLLTVMVGPMLEKATKHANRAEQ